MNKILIVTIDGDDFNSLDTFYDEVERKLTKDIDWQIGRNFAAFNDVLHGGFGVHEYDEPLKLIWKNSNKSKDDLGWTETIKYISKKLKKCHPSNVEDVKSELELTKQHKGQTLFDGIIEIIREHKHIQFELQ